MLLLLLLLRLARLREFRLESLRSELSDANLFALGEAGARRRFAVECRTGFECNQRGPADPPQRASRVEVGRLELEKLETWLHNQIIIINIAIKLSNDPKRLDSKRESGAAIGDFSARFSAN